MRPYIHQGDTWGFFHWNLHQSVGKAAQNGSRVDNTYIQWYYTLAATNVLTPPDRRAVYSRVKITGTCTGLPDDPLVAAITVHQRALDHPVVDGRISVAHGDGKVHEKAFFILRLNARFANMYPQYWPRLDLVKQCPPIVADAIRAAIPKP